MEAYLKMKQIYFNHDGGVDDLISLFLLLHMDDIKLVGVSAIGADSYIEPAVSASQKIVNRFSEQPIHIAASKERGKNPFPKDLLPSKSPYLSEIEPFDKGLFWKPPFE